jgi:flavin reductase (DIM6/NTAB) family NADH-FMN oxidoreductase RutF/DNA-binding IclR family transcriptional regulator
MTHENLIGCNPIEPRLFRETLSNYPTGVVIVTAVVDGSPAGMVVGSFTSVSLDPPLIAYLPAKDSSSYARLKRAERFCVNVLSVEQEALCRQFSARSGDKFAGVSWSLSEHGSPRLSDAVAWIECAAEKTVDAGDHDIVLGRVLALESSGSGSPLLFFQGGYGGFRSYSRVAPFASDLRDQLQIADLARGPMERLSDELGLECFAQAIVEGDLVMVAGVGRDAGTRVQIGRRLPFIPPYGAVFVADDPDHGVRRWTSNLRAAPELHETYRRMLKTVHERGWSLGLVAPRHDEIWAEVAGYTEVTPTPAIERRLGESMAELLPFYEPAELPAAPSHPRLIAAPVRAHERTVLAITLFGMPDSVSPGQLRHWADRLQATADEVSTLVEAAGR